MSIREAMPKQNNSKTYLLIIFFLTCIFLLAGILTSLLAFLYPLEIETRESGVWLNALALKAGVNIYDHSRVAFIYMVHGPFDSFFKFLISALFPFMEPWQVIRLPVFLLPYLFLFVSWRMLLKTSRSSALDVFYLGSLGYVYLMTLGDANLLLAGRNDATAALFLMPWLFISLSYPSTTKRLFYGCACGILAACVFLLNWRFAPLVLLVLLFTLWQQRYKYETGTKELCMYAALYALGFLTIYISFLGFLYRFDLSLYSKHHFSFIYDPYKWGTIFGASLGFWKRSSWPLLTSLAVYLTIPNKKRADNVAWAVFSLCVMAVYAIIFYTNQEGGGQHYYMPLLVVVWFFFSANYREVSRKSASVLGAILLSAYLALTFGDSGGFPTRLALTIKKAEDFMTKVRLAEKIGSIASEDSYLFRRSYSGELIDIGDLVCTMSSLGGLDAEFAATANRHFAQITRNPPDFIISGNSGSSILQMLLATQYDCIEAGPDNLIADRKYQRKFRSLLFVRKDFVLPQVKK